MLGKKLCCCLVVCCFLFSSKTFSQNNNLNLTPLTGTLGNTLGGLTTTVGGVTSSLGGTLNGVTGVLDTTVKTVVNDVNVVRLLSTVTSLLNKDVLTPLFHLGVNDLLGDKKEINFSSSIFAIRLKSNPDLDIAKNYFREKLSRNTNINYTVRMDNNFKFNGMGFGVKYALINDRDYTVARDFIPKVNAALTDYNKMFDRLTDVASAAAGDDITLARKYRNQIDSLFKWPGYTVAKMDPLLQAAIRDFDEKTKRNVAENIRRNYKDIVDEYANKPLVVTGADFISYTDELMPSNINIYLSGVGGIAKSKNKKFDTEFFGKFNLGFLDDTSRIGRDLKRSILSAEGGFNTVFRNNLLLPTVEFKLTVSDSITLTRLYKKEKQNRFLINGTLAIHITNEISLPLTVKYDPEHKDLLGVLNVVSNLDLLNKVLGKP